MKLNDKQIAHAAARERPYKLFDENGLYLEIRPNGSKWWRFRYTLLGKEKRISMGVYPEVSLKEARQRRDKAREQLFEGNDPSHIKKARKLAGVLSMEDCFEVVAREWVERSRDTWAPSHSKRIIDRLENDIFPFLGKRRISEITPLELLAALRQVENRGAVETAHRINQTCGQIFRYAIVTARATQDITLALKGALRPHKPKHLASIIDPQAIGELLRAIEGYKGSFIARCALRLAPLVFVRPGELRGAEWAEFEMGKAMWRIPPERMKMRRLHMVPLSRQAMAILEEIKPVTGHLKYVFPSTVKGNRPMSENTVLAALRRMGYSKDEMTGHGFRSMASTLLNEQGYNRDWIERQLAHAESNNVRAAYNYAEHIQERTKMMQEWADFLDSLRDNKE